MPAQEIFSSPFTLTLFGPMQVLVDGRSLAHMRSRKGPWLLALLALRHNHTVERAWLAGILWPGLELSQALANMRPILSELRAALGSQRERLQAPERHTLSLDLRGAQVDLIAFDAAIACQNLTALEEAVALYRGPLLEGCNEEWVFQERHAREQACLQALQQLGDAALAAGDYASAIGCYQRAVTRDPWQEAARRGWMEALARGGDLNSALRVYREWVEILRSDPEASPDEQMAALYQRLRAEARRAAPPTPPSSQLPATPPKVAGYLPHPLTDLIGREDERLEVAACLQRSRLVTLTGMGGIGKTRLALEVAREVAAEYPDGVWLIALDALSEDIQIWPQIAAILGLVEEAGRSLQASVATHLRAKRLLLLFDNCEHLLEASAQVVGHLLQTCREVRILATTREALEITGETIWAVPALSTPDPNYLPHGHTTLLRVLASYESVQLFVERAQSLQKSFALTGENALAVAQICSQLEGIPLAIELASARVRAMSVEQIAARLHADLSLLSGGNRLALSRQKTLRATLDWSYALLSASECLLLQRLSVFVGGWTLDAAEGICAEAPLEAWQIQDLLDTLGDKSLLVFEAREANPEKRYRLLEIVRQYAAEKLQESGESREIATRHRDWFVALSEAADLELLRANQKRWLERLTADYGNLRAAFACCGSDAQGVSAGLRLTGTLSRFWLIRGDLLECHRYLQAALANDRLPSPTKERGKALNADAVMLYHLGDYPAARELYLQALVVREQAGDRLGVGNTLAGLASVAHEMGEEALSNDYAQRSLQVCREVGDTYGICLRLENCGIQALQKFDVFAAKSFFEESLALWQEQGDRLQTARTLIRLSTIALLQGEYALMYQHLEVCQPILMEFGDRRDRAWALHIAANADLDHSHYDAAQALFEESLALFQEVGDKNGIGSSFQALGIVALERGNTAAARTWNTQSMQIFQEMNLASSITNALRSQGQIAYQEGDLAAATAAFTDCLHRDHSLDNKRGLLESIAGYAAVLLNQAEFAAAVRLMGALSRLHLNLGMPPSPNVRAKLETMAQRARADLGAEAFAVHWAKGEAMDREQIVAFALEATDMPSYPERAAPQKVAKNQPMTS